MDGSWIVGGDFNSSETFDGEWQDSHQLKFGIRSSGNREFLDRMKDLRFTECLREYTGKITPTFRHSKGQAIHQLDHLFISNNIYSRIKSCRVGQSTIFSDKLSDHLLIIADFSDRQDT